MNSQAHDINNQLNIIIGVCCRLRASQCPEKDLQSSVGTIEEAVYRASGLIKEIMRGFSEPERDREIVNVTELLDRIVHILDAMLDEKVTITDLGWRGAFHVHGYNQDLEQAFLNLALNARDAVGESGNIVIHREALDENGHSLEDCDADGGVRVLRVTVSDSGPGIPPQMREAVFEPFFTTKGPRHGTGLGLPIVSRVIREHGGSIGCVSAEEGGAEICVHLPGHNPAASGTCVG